MGPNFPLIPWPIDELGPNGRPDPRRFQFDISWNLQVSKQLARWTTLKAAATQCDVMNRCISIRQADVTKMDWSFTVSQDAVNTIMEDNDIGISEAAKIARKQFMPEIVRSSELMENPYPQSDLSWEQWVAEFMFAMLVYDGVAVHPAFTLGGKLLGFDLIDTPTIRCLLDNHGFTPRPPDPAYQQDLWGFPRGEFIASSNKNVTNYLGGEYNISDRDQLSYFIMHPRSDSPYGNSATEQALPIANIYLERQNWQLAEYKYGTTVRQYFETDSTDIELPNMASASRIIQDRFEGSTANRQGMLFLPGGVKNPTFAPSNDEKYKPDWDEFLKKSIASYYGVAPSQVGVTTRAGLGGGKGAAQGEQDGSETVSAKPQNKYVERSVDSLMRRYAGGTRNVAFTLKDDEGSEDELEISKANITYIGGAMKTPNEVRGELGLPLSTQPEADQLMWGTPQGPVYLEGTLAAQLAPPAPPPNAFGGPDAPVHNRGDSGPAAQSQEVPQKEVGQVKEGPSGGAPSGERQGGASSAALKRAEAGAFKRFVAKGGRREFEFVYHDEAEQAILKAGLADQGPKSRVLQYD